MTLIGLLALPEVERSPHTDVTDPEFSNGTAFFDRGNAGRKVIAPTDAEREDRKKFGHYHPPQIEVHEMG
ncbi:MAG: hypothetical protein KDA73_07785 [Rhodobacteraceae bacterium]|nr:hypothetical protein [Paracoccaceae bacterium]